MTEKRIVLSLCLIAAMGLVVSAAPAYAALISCEDCSCNRSCSYPCEEVDEGASTCGASGNLCIDHPSCAVCSCYTYIYGTSGNDTLPGTSYNNCIYGYAGNDSLYGYDGHDKLYGDSGDDSLYGGNGNDCLYGGSGYDYLDGGTGTDYCTEGETYVNCE